MRPGESPRVGVLRRLVSMAMGAGMSLRWRTLLVIGAAFVGLSVVLYGAARAILLDSLARVEEKNSRRNMNLILDLLSSESTNLGVEASDWAAWDESHAFVEDGNCEFSKRSLSNTAFYELDLDLIIFVHASGRVIFEKGFDREKKAEVPIPDGLRKHLAADGLLLRQGMDDKGGVDATTGVILLEEGPMLVASRSFTRGEADGPVRGKLIMGRFLDASFTKRLTDITHLSVSLERFGTSTVPPEAISKLTDPSAEPILTRTQNRDSIESLAVVKDVYGSPALIVRSEGPRDIYRLGEVGLGYLFISLVTIGLVFLVVALWFLEKLILSRVLRLSRAVNGIAAGMQSDMRVSVTGRDDLSQLASDINGMIEALASSQRERRDALVRFESVVENTPLVAIQGIDRSGVVEVWNETSSVLYGFTEMEALGRRLQDLVLAEEAAGEFVRTIEEVCDTGRAAAPREWEVKTREGGTRWIYSSMFPVNQNGGSASVFCMAVDITDRKHNEQALKENEEFLRVIFESGHMGIVIVDVDSHAVTSVNPAAAAMIGAEPEKIVGRSVRQLICPPYEEGCYIDDSGMEMDNLESVMMTSEGKRIPILKTAVAATLHGRRQMIESFIDISERKRTEEKLEAANRELEELNHELERTIEHAQKLAIRAQMASMSKSDFLARMSHEIRTPMNAVIGFTDLLMDTRLMDEQREYVDTIKRSGETLLGLINDILDLSRIEAGQLVLESVDFDPEAVACDVCELMLPRVKGKPLEILCRIGGTVPCLIKGDPNRFRQVLVNLMGNAVKFTESGEIELSLDIEEEKDGRMLLHAAVRDTGIGMPEGKLGRIFEAFQQSDSFITRKYGGSGLGLTICRQLSSLMGGTVRVQSKPGEGSVFHFTGWFGKIGEADAGISKPLAGKKALLIDANSASLDICAGILRSAGARVVESRLDADALSVMKAAVHVGDPFHFCIVNVSMPGACGYEVARLVRDDDSPVSSLPLLACSCAVEPGYRRSMEAGFSGFLPKPARRKNLVEAASELVAGRRGGITAPREERNVGADPGEVERTKREVRILLAEDNPANQRLAKLILLKEGYEVDVASNGLEAVKMFTSQPDRYQVILMDVQMPEMDGMAATKAIRAKGFGRIPIVAMTANAMKGDREKCLEAGMNDYFPKPIRREAVSKIVEKWAAIEDRA